jgi:hypothetical protein
MRPFYSSDRADSPDQPPQQMKFSDSEQAWVQKRISTIELTLSKFSIAGLVRRAVPNATATVFVMDSCDIIKLKALEAAANSFAYALKVNNCRARKLRYSSILAPHRGHLS